MLSFFNHFVNTYSDSMLDAEELKANESNPFVAMQQAIKPQNSNVESIDGFFKNLGPKPGGTDVGHLVDLNGEKTIIKTGITLSLLGQSLVEYYNERPKKLKEYDEKYSKEVEDYNSQLKLTEEQIFREKSHTWLGYIAGGFIKVIRDKSKTGDEWSADEKALKRKLCDAFDKFLTTDTSKSLAARINSTPQEKKTYKCDVDDVTAIYKSLITKEDGTIDQDIINTIGFPLFADLINGSFSQQINNLFQEQFAAPIAKQQLLMLQKDAPCMLMASTLLSDVQGFDRFLIEPFLNNDRADYASDEEWINAGKAELEAKFAGKNIDNLIQMILVRFVFGESADLGPDNMLISRNDKAWSISNIDLTGFRYERSNNFDIKNKAGEVVETKFGWKHILSEQAKIVDNLLNGAVFSSRFVDDHQQVGKKVEKPKNKEIYNAIVEVLKSKIGEPALVQKAVDEFITWGASLDSSLLNKQMEQAIDKSYGGLSDILKFDEKYLSKLKTFNAQFLDKFVSFATEKSCKMEIDEPKNYAASSLTARP